MKMRSMKLCAFVVAVILLISSLPLFATAAQPTTYSSQSNSGTRGEVCTSLEGTSADDYYTGNYDYDVLVTLSEDQLLTSLHTLMKTTHKNITSYNDCRDYVWQTDCERNNTSYATSLYTDHDITSGEWSPSWTYNREHVWPQSSGGGNTSGGGADLHHIRPANASVNSSRGSKPYGTGSGCYEPADYVKGDVARIVLYVHVRWGSEWGATNINSVFESVDVLLAWCALDPVDTWEMGRNEVVQRIQGNRNVFIDYPELAWQMYGKAVPENMYSPSNAAATGNVPQPPAGGVEDVTPDNTPTEPAEIPSTLVLKNGSNYVTAQPYVYTSQSSGTSKNELALSTSKSDAVALSYVQNGDGTVSFKAGDKFLLADGTNVEFVDAASDNTKFILEWNNTGYFIKCATATYQDKAQYLEIYGNYLTCYGMQANPTNYTFTLESANGASSSTPDGSGSTTQKPSTPEDPVDPADGPVVFDFGPNVTAHSDGTEITGSKSYTSGDYTLTLTDMTKIFGGAADTMGNSCLKVGTSSKAGGFSFTVDEDVEKVIIYVTNYKAKTVNLTVNGKSYTVNTSSFDGAYTPVEIDTSVSKNVTLATSGSTTGRCMINTIELYVAAPEVEEPEETTTAPAVDPIEPDEDTTTTAPAVDPSEPDETTTAPAGDPSEPDETTTEEILYPGVTTEPATDPDGDPEDVTTEPEVESETLFPSLFGQGCGSSIAGGTAIVSVLVIGLFALAYRKKED